MRTFNYSAIRSQQWDSEVIALIAGIYQGAGKSTFYVKAPEPHLAKLRNVATRHSTEASNAIEGITTSPTRLRQLLANQTQPKNEDEAQILGYRDAHVTILDNYRSMPLLPTQILALHKMLYCHMDNPMAGKLKTVQNVISASYPDGHVEIRFTPLSPLETPRALTRLCYEYNQVVNNLELEPLLAIPIFILDFLCIHPFNDGNGRMSRLLTTWLLARCSFFVGQYVSLEANVASHVDRYYDALARSSVGWHEGREDPRPFIKYWLSTVLAAYNAWGDAYELMDPHQSALEVVRQATLRQMGRFTKDTIRDLCPALSLSSIEAALRTLVKNGELHRTGTGKATRYHQALPA